VLKAEHTETMVKRNFVPYEASEIARSKRARVAKPMRSYIARATRQAVLRLAEKKHLNTQIDEVGLSSLVQGGDWWHLTNIADGSNSGNRIGSQVALHSMNFRGVLHNNSSGTHLVRVVLGYIEDEVAPSNVYDLFEGPLGPEAPVSFTAGAAAGLNSMYQPLNKSKITVLYDQVHKVGANSSIDGSQVKMFEIKKNLRNAKIRFEGVTRGAGNQNRMLYLGAWTTEGADDTSLGTTTEISGCAQLHYTDL